MHTLLRLPTGIWYSPGVKANIIFFDKREGRAKPWTDKLWVYDLRTNQHFTLKQKRQPLGRYRQCRSTPPTESGGPVSVLAVLISKSKEREDDPRMNEHTNETPRGRYLATLHAELESVFKTFLSHACIADKQLLLLTCTSTIRTGSAMKSYP